MSISLSLSLLRVGDEDGDPDGAPEEEQLHLDEVAYYTILYYNILY